MELVLNAIIKSHLSPTVNKLLHRYRTRIGRLSKKIHILKRANAECTRKCTLPSGIIHNASKYLDGFSLEFFKTQLDLSTVQKKGRRYSDIQRCFSLGLYFKSARTCKLLSKIFALPTVRMLRYWVQRIHFTAGWNKSVFELLKKKTQSFEPKDKVCGIVFDAVSIKAGVYYDTSKDKFEGLEDLGQYGIS